MEDGARPEEFELDPLNRQPLVPVVLRCIDDVRRKKSNELREWIDGLRAAAAPRRLKLPGGDVPERV